MQDIETPRTHIEEMRDIMNFRIPMPLFETIAFLAIIGMFSMVG